MAYINLFEDKKMKTNKLFIESIYLCKKHGFIYVRDCLWDLRFMSKITDKQLLDCFELLHKKGF